MHPGVFLSRFIANFRLSPATPAPAIETVLRQQRSLRLSSLHQLRAVGARVVEIELALFYVSRLQIEQLTPALA